MESPTLVLPKPILAKPNLDTSESNVAEVCRNSCFRSNLGKGNEVSGVSNFIISSGFQFFVDLNIKFTMSVCTILLGICSLISWTVKPFPGGMLSQLSHNRKSEPMEFGNNRLLIVQSLDIFVPRNLAASEKTLKRLITCYTLLLQLPRKTIQQA